MSNADRLTAIEARANAATPGPWLLDPAIPHVVDIRRPEPMSFLVIHDDPNGPESARPDAEFIAAARTDVPDLVATLRAVEAKATEWASKAPADDWGDDLGVTFVADAGRAILAVIEQKLGSA